jgi:hypothetical protein
MRNFKISDTVATARKIYAGPREDGPLVCEKSTMGIVVSVDSHEWDGILVKLDNNMTWWFKPTQLMHTTVNI